MSPFNGKPFTSWLPHPGIQPEEWIEVQAANRKYFRGPKDTRIAAYLPQLTREICLLRAGLLHLRLAFSEHSEAFLKFRLRLTETGSHPYGSGSSEHLERLLTNYMSRIDWREQDVLEMVLDFLMSLYLAGSEEVPRPNSVGGELRAFRTLRLEDSLSCERTIQGWISEARGNLLGLTQACCELQETGQRLSALGAQAVSLLGNSLSRLLCLPQTSAEQREGLPQDPASLWDALYEDAQQVWKENGVPLPLKPLEKASLFLLEAIPVDVTGHAAFVRYLIEHEDAYRRLLAVSYAPLQEQKQRLQEEVERYNRLPEHAAHSVHYADDEQESFMYAFLLRPDPVAAIAERERFKDIYRVVSGLGPKAYLPRVLQEIHNIYGYITPEAFQWTVKHLGLEPAEIIKVIASYKQYSVDPGGDIIIYICKGTACFLRGQPELSRRLAGEIQAQEGEVGRRGIQFIEMDCFGVCHLAPVVKTRDAFLGNRTADEIPELLGQLLKGPSYDNRLLFLNRIRELLAPGKESDRLEEVRILNVIESRTDTGTHTPYAASSLGTAAPFGAGLRGQCLQIESNGQVNACSNGHSTTLGYLLKDCLAFTRTAPDGTLQTSAVLLDENRQVLASANFDSPELAREIRQTARPQAYVADGSVWLGRMSRRLWLGNYNANVVAVKWGDGIRLIELSGPPHHSPPQKDEGLSTSQPQDENQAFLAAQDRLVLGFTAGTDPQEIDSYIERGGYGAVLRVLGLGGEPAWSPRDITREISSAKLRGRGGAGFPTGRKWEAVYLAKCLLEEKDENQDAIKLIVANGDEGDPGAFMDRTLIQERPHQLIEGMVLAALATQARYGVIYVRKEYEDAVRRLEHALFQARRKGFLGENIFGIANLHFDLDIRLGAGAFVAGEKRAIMRAIEGEAAEPTLNALSNTHRGLWGKPTLLNNVETFANVPLIIQRGAGWYAGQGTERSGGSKIFSVAGIVKQTGLVEVRFGRTLNDIIRICGGIQENKHLAGVQIGGPSGAILSLTGVREYLLHTPLDFDTFDQVGAMLGSGGLVFIGEDDDVVRLARHFTDWLAEESCGQCPPCLQGTVSLGETLDVILQGEATSEHIHALWAKSDTIKAGSQCGLGMTAANPVTSALRFFPHAFLHYLLANPRVTRLELFRILEALRLLTRENIDKIWARKRQTVGYSFLLKKHLLRHLATELEHLDQYRPLNQQQAKRFLDLLQVPTHEIGTRDVLMECTLEELEQQRLYLQDWNYDRLVEMGMAGS